MAQTSSPTSTYTLAVVGNPNAGKTTVFNALTGSRQKVGNYPGVTVERVSGFLQVGDLRVECIDVPGLYSLKPVSEDERVAADVIFGRSEGTAKPDGLLCILDSSNLERNLYLFAQLAEAQIPTLVAITMVDRVAGGGRTIDVEQLSSMLGVEVVPVVGHKEQGIDKLREAIGRLGAEPRFPNRPFEVSDETRASVDSLKERLARIGADVEEAEVLGQLQGKETALGPVLDQAPELREAFEHARATLTEGGGQPDEVHVRYAWAASVQKAVLAGKPKGNVKSTTDKIDAILTHRVFGLLVFVAVMYLVFQSIYTFAQPEMDLIKNGFDSLAGLVSPLLKGVPVLQSLVCDGLIGGVGSMLQFLPQILILFFFIAVLEGSGYLARAAFLMDRLLGWCGLNGRAFIPLLSSFACAIPGIMAARVMPDKRSRLATILVAPLMSCSARLPVYLLLIGAFIEPKFGPAWAGFTLFAMHLLGLVVAIPIVWFLNRKVIKGKRLPFVLELPPYQWPKWRDVWLAMYFRGKVFVTVAGTTIVMMSMLIWGLSYFPRSASDEAHYKQVYAASHPGAPDAEVQGYADERQLSNSLLGRFGQGIQPVFQPAGFDWRITTAILSAFPARETVVPSLGILFHLGKGVESESTDLRSSVAKATWDDGRPLLTPYSAVGLMVFFALCCQCMSTLATVRRETNSWKWPAFMFTYMTTLAYIGAVAVNQLGIWLSR